MKPARTAGLWDARRQVEILREAGLMVLGSGLTDPDVSLAASLALFGAFQLKHPAALNGPQFLTRSFLRTWGERWYKDAPLLLRFLDADALYEETTKDLEDLIVLTKRLPDEVNSYATANIYGVVTKVDDQQVSSLEDLARLLEAKAGEYAVIRFLGSDEPLVLSRRRVATRNQAINTKYGVVPDRWLKGQEADGAVTREAQR